MPGQVDIMRRDASPADMALKPAVAHESAAIPAPGPDFSLNRLYYVSDAARPTLRIGVMVNRSPAPQLFMRKVLEDIRHSNFATLECVIVNCEAPLRPKQQGSLPVRATRALLDGERRR